MRAVNSLHFFKFTFSSLISITIILIIKCHYLFDFPSRLYFLFFILHCTDSGMTVSIEGGRMLV